jgi:hypothetical protein
MRGKLILFTFVGLLLFATGAYSQGSATGNATIAWTPSTSPNVAGYDVYYGTSSGNYNSAVSVLNPSATSVTIRGLTNGTTYYFAATSFDYSNNQSGFSAEISGVIGSTVSAAATLTSLFTSSGQFGFTVNGAANSQYMVQASTDLVHWVTLQTNAASSSFVDSNAAQFPHRYYRTAFISN